MSLTQHRGDIVLQCDGKDGKPCHESLDTHTSNLDSARNCWRRNQWKVSRVKGSADEYRHTCPECQKGLI